jgi:hypothetical protein
MDLIFYLDGLTDFLCISRTSLNLNEGFIISGYVNILKMRYLEIQSLNQT